MNNDGELDVVAGTFYNASYSAGVVSLLLNNRDGTSPQPKTPSLVTTPTKWRWVT